MNEVNELNKKYSKIYIGTSLLHLAFLIIGVIGSFPILTVYNVFSIGFYLALSALAGKGTKLSILFRVCFAEIVVFSVGFSIVFGWNSGFMLYIIGILPLTFYSTYILANMRLKYAFRYSAMIIVIFFVTMTACFHDSLRVYQISAAQEHIFYTINAAAAFLLLIGFLSIFIRRVKMDRLVMEREKEFLEASALFDPLTGLQNRRSFDLSVKSMAGIAEDGGDGFSVLMCDVDNFKEINDTYGHECGDLVLINISGVLRDALREEDKVFRWGGEELAILISGDVNVKQIAERCRAAVEASRVIYKDQRVGVTVTIGCSIWKKGTGCDELVALADENMYIGKKCGKNQVVI